MSVMSSDEIVSALERARWELSEIKAERSWYEDAGLPRQIELEEEIEALHAQLRQALSYEAIMAELRQLVQRSGCAQHAEFVR
jgi:hypothetical protein